MKRSTLLKWGTAILITIALIGGWATTRVVWAQASTWHVATDGSDITGDGSEAKPFATIQHGIDAASHGDSVLVHPGVYKENINFNGKNITVGSLFVTTGDQDYMLQTVIDGKRNDHVVTFAGGEAATARLSGFTITNGPVYWGRGNMDAAPRFVNAGLGNYHLANDSPGINAGTAANALLTDIEGNPRPSPAGSHPDMGAYENRFGRPHAGRHDDH